MPENQSELTSIGVSRLIKALDTLPYDVSGVDALMKDIVLRDFSIQHLLQTLQQENTSVFNRLLAYLSGMGITAAIEEDTSPSTQNDAQEETDLDVFSQDSASSTQISPYFKAITSFLDEEAEEEDDDDPFFKPYHPDCLLPYATHQWAMHIKAFVETMHIEVSTDLLSKLNRKIQTLSFAIDKPRILETLTHQLTAPSLMIFIQRNPKYFQKSQTRTQLEIICIDELSRQDALFCLQLLTSAQLQDLIKESSLKEKRNSSGCG
ncbi:MAG: hypothetical protein NTW08_07805 [Gammaproteobacteria bacterium]|nr:hypothetical protein [Gammaproteobacteria bacterium]